MDSIVRDYRNEDFAAVRRCIVELQDVERTIDARLRPGQSIADDYLTQVLARCATSNGKVFVAEQAGAVVGVLVVFATETFTELDDPPGTYAMVSDVAVLSSHRGQGIGRQLLRHAEMFVREAGAVELRIGVLVKNTVARQLYLDVGFAPHQEILIKRW